MRITYLDEPTFLSPEFESRMAELGEFTVWHDRPSPATAVRRLNDCDIAIVEWTALTADMFAQMRRVRHIVLVTTSFDFVDLAAASRAGITVANCPAYSSEAVGEHVFALLLAVARRLLAGDAAVRRGDHIDHAPYLGIGLRGRTLGLIGTGGTARAVAALAAAGFGMRIIGTNRSGTPVSGIEPTGLADVVAGSDFLSVHVPLDDSTRGLLDARLLESMKPSAILVNTSRGEVIDQPALLRLLTDGKIAGAGLDHLAADSKEHIRSLPNVVLTPGIAWYTDESRRANLDVIYENVAAYLNGERRNVLNPVPVLTHTDRIKGMSVVTDNAFVPPDFEVPPGLSEDGLRLLPLGPEHNDRDYQAWTTSVEHIRRTPGFTEYPWPYDMSIDENLADLRQHAADFQQRSGFTYTVLSGDELVGCVYIYPTKTPGWAAVRSWVRHDRAELDTKLYAIVRHWLDDAWPFDGVEYSPRELQAAEG
ncbi:phosphoglycerate dehydrogenase-like enzyme [Actinoplanes tereljensis]|uniref:Glycerate dehydrogenase n=1 Tax=Paractinoplanes tereljensis TaxID=571912 RepID=A0A919TQP5_9ACTN|nr:NAD(P)-dependent oxidoreductase [Actinoplanes tereljensis]GIF17347.1 hypothetical protein Ate02nite_00770 [Actinoplanes tereljensis]